MSNKIEKTLYLNATVSRVWTAITDSQEFGAWFRVKLEGPFVVGEKTAGQITYPGHEHMRWEAVVTAIEPQKLFAFRWCPYGGDAAVDYSDEVHTLVEFRLEAHGAGTRLHITESGFDDVPPDKREECRQRNDGGWEVQLGHIRTHVDG